MRKSVFAVVALSLGLSGIGAVDALAADLAPRPYVKAPIAPPVPLYSWTGFYIGGNIGYSWGRSADNSTVTNGAGTVLFTDSNSSHLNGVVGGGQLGYNWQVDRTWVLGLEADIQGTGEKGNINFTCPTGVCAAPFGVIAVFPGAAVPLTLSQQIDWFGTVRGRVGVLASPTWMVYATGGLAYGEVKSTAESATSSISGTNTRAGWTVGGGVEGAIGGNWTVKVEYLYVDLGRVSGGLNTGIAAFGGGTLTENYSSRITDNIVRVGVNYRFGGPVVARY